MPYLATILESRYYLPHLRRSQSDLSKVAKVGQEKARILSFWLSTKQSHTLTYLCALLPKTQYGNGWKLFFLQIIEQPVLFKRMGEGLHKELQAVFKLTHV